MPLKTRLELLRRSDIIRVVIGVYNGNDTMLQWSYQLLLVENELLQGGIDLKEVMTG